MITERQLRGVRRYCLDDISKIENYDKALTDIDVRYDCHHRLEVGKYGEVISHKDLIARGLYYNRPASELIFLTKSEHNRLHKKGNKTALERITLKKPRGKYLKHRKLIGKENEWSNSNNKNSLIGVSISVIILVVVLMTTY